MAQDIQDWTQAVNVTGGTVAIGGTASVSIVGTPTVSISGTPTVNIAGTPTVTISGGSVNIANASIAVINATGTKITSSRPPVLLTVVGDSNIGTTNSVPVPADIQALVIAFPGDPTLIAHAKISWQPVGGATPAWVPFETYRVSQQVYVVPVTPGARGLGVGETTTLLAFLLVTAAHYGEMEIWGLFESNPLWLEYFAPPFAEPNQPPISTNVVITAAATNYPIIAPVANVEIWLFTLALLSAQGFGAVTGISIGYGPNAASVTEMMTDDVISSTAGGPSHIINFGGVPLGRGNGLYIHKAGGGGVGAWIDGVVTYSLG